MAWLQGLYVKGAVASALSDENKYPEHPYGIFDTEEERQEKEAKKVDTNRQLIEAQILQVQSYFKKQNGKQ